MSTDRELLELAAKAVGIGGWFGQVLVNGDTIHHDDFYVDGDSWWALDPDNPSGSWDPLTDDGDAFRLAVNLNLTVTTSHVGAMASYKKPIGNNAGSIELIVEREYKFAATRRAIVRAAAEIGKAKEDK